MIKKWNWWSFFHFTQFQTLETVPHCIKNVNVPGTQYVHVGTHINIYILHTYIHVVCTHMYYVL